VLSVTLLDFNTEKTVTARANSVAPGSCDLSLHETCLKHHHSLFEATANDLGQTSDDLSFRTLFCTLEQQCSALDARVLALHSAASEEIEDPVVVNLVHGNNDSILGGGVGGYLNIGDRRSLR
jgi:hypothetical protein